MRQVFNVVSLSHQLIQEHLKPGQTAVDATCGNGNDTQLLAETVGEDGYVYAFDIQHEAVTTTSELLKQKNLKNVTVIKDGHENIRTYIKHGIDCAVFNLGFLPSVGENIKTETKTTIHAVNQICDMLNPDGFITICAYVQHRGGMQEYRALLKTVSALDKEVFQTLVCDQPNQSKNAPKILFIRKKVDF